MKNLKKYELGLVSNLRKNARTSLTKLAKSLNVPISTLFDRLKLHKKSGLIKKFTVLINYGWFGYHTRITIILKVRKDEKEKINQFLFNHFSVNSLYKINNGFDFMIDCIFKGIKELEEFISDLEERFHLKTINVYYVIEEIKEEGFMENNQDLNEVMLE